MAKTARQAARGAAQDAFRTKWHRARLMEQGLSRDAVNRRIARMKQDGDLSRQSTSVPRASRSRDGGSPYRRWANQDGERLAPDNGKSPWRNFVNGGGAAKIADKLDFGHSERQARYRKNREENKNEKLREGGVSVSREAINRRLKAQRNQKNKAGR